LLAATVHSFAHMLLGISDRNNSVSEQTLVKGDIQLLFMIVDLISGKEYKVDLK